MAEGGGGGGGGGGAKVRVVRCPRCQKLLPELPNFSVYRCGGCDATLQAKKQISASESLSEKSDGEKVKYVEVLDSGEVKKDVASDASPETGHESDEVELRRVERLLSEEAVKSRSKSLAENEDSEVNEILTEPGISRLDAIANERTDGRDDRYLRPSKAPVSDHNRHVNELVERNIVDKVAIGTTIEHDDGLHQALLKGEEKDRVSRPPTEGTCPASYPDEGPSNYRWDPRYDLGNGKCGDGQNPDGLNKIGHLEQDRAELLRMLDELRVQVQRSCEATDKQKASAPVNRAPIPSSSYGHRDRGTWFPEGSASLNRNFSRCSPFLDGQSMDMPNCGHAVPVQNNIPGYGEPLTRGGDPFHPPGRFPSRQLDGYLYGEFNPNPLVSYHHEGFYHQPACSCLHCYHKQFSQPVQGPLAIYSHQRVPYFVNSHGFYPMDGPSTFNTRGYNARVTKVSLRTHEPRSHKSTFFGKKVGPSCRPVAGAAPFSICYNCFELLQLPENPLVVEKKNPFKLRCGSCFKVLLLKLEGNRLVTSDPASTLHASSEDANNSNGSPGDEVPSTDERLLLPYSFTGHDHELTEKEHGLSLSGSERMRGLSSSSSTSGRLESPESVISQKDDPSLSEIPLGAEVISRVPSLPLREHFEYSLSDKSVDGSGDGSRSKRSDQEKNIPSNGNLKQNSVKDVPVASEMDFSVDEYPAAGLSHDSWDMISEDEVQPRIIKGGDSFLASLIKKSFRDFSRGHSRTKVSINGRPITDRLVKKAQKQAGPIYPGDYWYDYRAGFWGVMGHPCLGIILPYIEEFNYPMPKNCADGNSGVLVNGRELHHKDLDLLVGRGLPATAGRSYIIEISGKVWDESTGEELDCLGKLAPTVERLKHGFGMRVPRIFV